MRGIGEVRNEKGRRGGKLANTTIQKYEAERCRVLALSSRILALSRCKHGRDLSEAMYYERGSSV